MKHLFIYTIINVVNKKMAEISVFSAIIIVLQIIATFVNLGSFPITLTLIPIVVAGCVYGETVGAIMGLVFGIIVLIMVITGADPSGLIMFTNRPVITVIVCLLKGVLCGYVSALLYKIISKKNEKTALIVSALSCPIINTAVLAAFLLLFFDTSLKALIGMFLSINFIIEVLINILLAPRLTHLIKRGKNRYS